MRVGCKVWKQLLEATDALKLPRAQLLAGTRGLAATIALADHEWDIFVVVLNKGRRFPLRPDSIWAVA